MRTCSSLLSVDPTRIIIRGIILRFLCVVIVLFLTACLRSSASELPRGEIEGSISDLPNHGHGVSVTAFLLHALRGYPAFTVECQTNTDYEGNYKCSSVPSGYYVLLACPIHKFHSVLPKEAPSSTFYPGTTDIENVELVKVKSNTINVFSFSMLEESLYQVSGRVDSKPNSVSFELYRIDALRQFRITSGEVVKYDSATGNFMISGVSRGQYILEGNIYSKREPNDSSTDGTPQVGSKTIIVDDDNVSNLVITPESLANIYGQVEIEGAMPKYSFKLELQNVGDGHKIYEITISPSGTFRLNGVSPGNYLLTNQSLQNAYIQSVKIDNFVSTSGQFLINGTSNVHFKINMSLRSKTILGTVSDFPSGKYHAYVIAKNKLTGEVHITETDQRCRFSIGNLSPGEYSLYAWESLDGIAYHTSYGLKQYDNNKITVSTGDILSTGEVVVPLSNSSR